MPELITIDSAYIKLDSLLKLAMLLRAKPLRLKRQPHQWQRQLHRQRRNKATQLRKHQQPPLNKRMRRKQHRQPRQ